jgi:hypothetical protein
MEYSAFRLLICWDVSAFKLSNNIFLYSITYISGEDAAAYQSSRVGEQSPPPPTMMPSPK